MRSYPLIGNAFWWGSLRSFLSKNSSSRAFWAGDGWYRSAGAMTLVGASFRRLTRSPISFYLRVTATEFTGLDASRFQQVLVTEYSPGAGIGWHKDRPEFEHVIGVSLLSPCLFRLRRKRGNGWERASIELQPRSAYLLSGSARTDWQHSIPPVDKLRYSVTFRSFRR
jgi:alkylated DNA repair dioxygenase AlkB